MYEDPDNTLDIILEIKTKCPTIKDIFDVINRTYPNLISSCSSKYSDDYPHLTHNWNFMCEQIQGKIHNIRKGLIVLLNTKEIKDGSLISFFSETLMLCGCVVRLSSDYHVCEICKSVIPSEKNYLKFKQLCVSIPKEYSITCEKCKSN
tara:strand:- start:2770 stop:3216 length:447 start_codon:yes stop_codon:yes gene_type:complete